MTATKQMLENQSLLEEKVILVDENDQPIGSVDKLTAHRDNLRHRAFSIFVLRGNEILLQQRALTKYHSPGLWTNTCCSHPRPEESIVAAGERRLKEEMGLSLPLHNAGNFHYIAHFDNGLVENEIDHVLIGQTNTDTIPFNPMEVASYRWINLQTLEKEIKENPKLFTPWLVLALPFVKKFMHSQH